MQTAPENFEEIYRSGEYTVEYRVQIDGVNYSQNSIWSMRTNRQLFSINTPMIGCAMVGQIDLSIYALSENIPKQASIKPFIRLRSKENSSLLSGWVQKGEFFIDTRNSETDGDVDILDLQGFDALRRANKKYPSSTLRWSDGSPSTYEVVLEIASFMGVEVEDDTIIYLHDTPYVVAFPAQYTMAEVLGSIAAMYGGNFCMSDTGKLKLVVITRLPEETFFLVDGNGDYLTFGSGDNETAILIR